MKQKYNGAVHEILVFIPYHWRSLDYAYMHVCNKNSNIQERSTNVVNMIFHIIRNCS